MNREAQLAIIAVQMILTHGVPVFIQAMRTIEGDEPTLEEIRALRGAVKDPAGYFAEKSKR